MGIVGSSNRFFGVSSVIHDVDGWRVLQNLEQTSILQNITGSSIDTSYVIMSYMNSNAPSGSIDFGSGPSTDVEISIRSIASTTPEPIVDNTQRILGGIGLVSVAFVVSTLLIRHQKHGKS